MNYLCAILLVLQMVSFCKGKPHLETFRSVNITEVARCAGKTRCSDGRCIKESDCCHEPQPRIKCLLIYSTACCAAVNNGNHHIPNNLDKTYYSIKSNPIPSIKTDGSIKLGKKVLWIILAPIIALGAAVRCIVKKCKGKNNTQSPAITNAIPLPNVYQEVPTSDTNCTRQPNNRVSNLPPTYNDIVTKRPETTAVLVNNFHR